MPVRPSIRRDSHPSWTLTFNHKLPLKGDTNMPHLINKFSPGTRLSSQTWSTWQWARDSTSRQLQGKAEWDSWQWRSTGTHIPAWSSPAVPGSCSHSREDSATHRVQVPPARATPSPAATPGLPTLWQLQCHHSNHRQLKTSHKENISEVLNVFFVFPLS